MAKGICSIESCESPILSRGWCGTHYARWRKHGDPQYQRPLAKDLPCSAPGCDKRQRVNGYCQMHDRRVKKFGSPDGRKRVRRPCVGPGCVNTVGDMSATNLCRGHYKQHNLGKELTPLRVTDPDRPKFCTFPDCDRPNKSGGLCAAHVAQGERGQPLRPVRANSRARVPCDAEGCDQVRITRNYCDRHYSVRIRRWAMYGITPDCGQRIYSLQGQACPVCQVGHHIDDLHIDHDHTCCPSGAVGCGNCVRGLLCARCNKGLGYFQDDPERLSNAALYLRAHITE